MMELSKLTKNETDLIAEFFAGRNEKIEILLPDDLEAKQVVKYADTACKLIYRNESERAVLIAAVGRLHYLARTRKDVLAAAKCETIVEFEERLGVTSSIRTSVWKASSAYKALPGLTPNEYAEIGSSKLAIAAQHMPKGASESQRKKFLDKAKEKGSTVEDYREWVETKSGVSGPGETQTASLKVIGSAAAIKELEEFLRMPSFQAWAESNRPIDMIMAAIRSSAPEFMGVEWEDVPGEEGPEDEAPAPVAQPAEESEAAAGDAILDAEYEEVPPPVQQAMNESSAAGQSSSGGEDDLARW